MKYKKHVWEASNIAYLREKNKLEGIYVIFLGLVELFYLFLNFSKCLDVAFENYLPSLLQFPNLLFVIH